MNWWLKLIDRAEEKAVIAATLWMTWRSFQWANDYAEIVLAANNDGATLASAAMIAAVTAPIAALQGYVLKAYAVKESPS